ncbi:uncharacterized protein F4822DRAFT_101581 [Hypoxylon trugodes]|uniref:uncharacterized protein n=1 Tax=Hypoxylon trugodes TaxID=326681 RepID=UPI00218EC9EC|nr:uncharacterized protein F4822DRAFT_101581 [Hypoxylon trugodes]KAI1382643.1 hypothetical protein F4822DRAFT_101581 [Hypoxylon trugodes]
MDLPYYRPHHSTFADAEVTRCLLQCRVPAELAIYMVSLGLRPWLVKRRDHPRRYAANFSRPGADASIAGLYLSTQCIPTTVERTIVPRRIVFQTRSADRGWATYSSDGTFNNSHTWFEASILRPFLQNDGGNGQGVALEDAFGRNTWWEPIDAREALREKGWDFVEAEDGCVMWRVCNNITALMEWRNYKVEWVRGVETMVKDEKAQGKGEGFLELLKPGCIVVLWARAERGCFNEVTAATIEIEYEMI